MAWQKIWLGTTDTDFALATNWQKISIRTSAFAWTVGANGTSNYFVRAAGPVDPAFGGKPGAVYLNGTLAAEGTLGALAVGQWAWGDDDSLGYSTIYVRTSGSVDPDTLARDYVQFQGVPNGADLITISSAATRGITLNVDQSALSSAPWVIEPGFKDKPLGLQGQPLRITPSALNIDGGGSSAWYIDIGSANIPVEVRGAPASSGGLLGLYLTGTNITTLTVRAGSVGVAMQPGDVSTVATVITTGGQAVVALGPGVTLTTARSVQGSIVLRCGGTTFDCQGGLMETQLSAVASGNVYVTAGTFTDKSIGTHAAVTMNGGTMDTTQLTGAKTFSTFLHNAGTFKENTELLTITTRQEPTVSGTTVRSRVA